MRKKKESERQQLRKQYLEQQRVEEFVKPRLPKEVMEGSMIGQLATELVGDEPPDDLFMTLLSITQIGLSDTQFTLNMGGGRQEELDMSVAEPLFFVRPFYPRTMEIVRHLAALGHLRLAGQRTNGCMYDVVVPPKGQRREWMANVLDEIQKFVWPERTPNPAENEKFKASLNYISDELLATFPEPQRSAHDCTVCRAAVGRWNGVVKVDVPEQMKGIVAQCFHELMICPTCYELPDLFERVKAAVPNYVPFESSQELEEVSVS